VQFQNRIGRWSEVLWVGDKKVDIYPYIESIESANDSNTLKGNKNVKGKITLSKELLNKAYSLGYIKVRGVIVYPSVNDRDILCQGILNPTVYK
jgi:hypothetical protein